MRLNILWDASYLIGLWMPKQVFEVLIYYCKEKILRNIDYIIVSAQPWFISPCSFLFPDSKY